MTISGKRDSFRKHIPTLKEFQDLQRIVYLQLWLFMQLSERIADILPIRFADSCRGTKSLDAIRSRLDDLACRAHPDAAFVFYGGLDWVGKNCDFQGILDRLLEIPSFTNREPDGRGLRTVK